MGSKGYGGFESRTAIMAMIGGTTSVISGGKFANGAVTGAFVHMFNAEFEDNLARKVAFGNDSDKLSVRIGESIGRGVDNVVKAFSGLANGLNSLMTKDISNMSLEQQATFKYMRMRLKTNLNTSQSINVIDKVDMYNEVK